MQNTGAPAPDPIEKFRVWYVEAQTGGKKQGFKNSVKAWGLATLRQWVSTLFPESNLFRPDVAALATVANGKPSARYVLFHGMVEGGFTFYTDYDSDKGRELAANPAAVLVFYWRLPPRQVRIDGKVIKLSREDAEIYWESRSRANQAAAAAVRQSDLLASRDEFVHKVREIEQKYRGKPIPCPDSWGGYSLLPEKIEFWEGRRDWLHDRDSYIRDKDDRWKRVILAP